MNPLSWPPAPAHGRSVSPGDMEAEWLWLACVAAAALAVMPFPVGGPVHAQTIDSRDTRTFQDSRGQDDRQNPTGIPPGEVERLKKLTERATIPDDTKDTTPPSPQNTERPSAKPHDPPVKQK